MFPKWLTKLVSPVTRTFLTISTTFLECHQKNSSFTIQRILTRRAYGNCWNRRNIIPITLLNCGQSPYPVALSAFFALEEKQMHLSILTALISNFEIGLTAVAYLYRSNLQPYDEKQVKNPNFCNLPIPT